MDQVLPFVTYWHYIHYTVQGDALITLKSYYAVRKTGNARPKHQGPQNTVHSTKVGKTSTYCNCLVQKPFSLQLQVITD